MAFERAKKPPSPTKLADNLNDLCKKLNTAMERKKDLKAAKFATMYDKCCTLRSQLEDAATKLLDSNNTKDFDYVANISHRASRILSNFEKLTARPAYMSTISSLTAVSSNTIPPPVAQVESVPNDFADFSQFDSLVRIPTDPQGGPTDPRETNLSKAESRDSDWANFNDAAEPHTADAKHKSVATARDFGYDPDRKYRKDYLDSNMDTSVDYFNTSLDHHNAAFDSHCHESDERRETEDDLSELENLKNRKDYDHSRRDHVRRSEGHGTRRGDHESRRRGPSENRKRGDLDHRAKNDAHYRSREGPEIRMNHDLESRKDTDHVRKQVPEPRVDSVIETHKQEQPPSRNFVTSNHYESLNREKVLREPLERGPVDPVRDMEQYIKLLERFLSMTKYNSIVNRLNNHSDLKYKAELLQSYYNATYDGAGRDNFSFQSENEMLKSIYNADGGHGIYSSGLALGRNNMKHGANAALHDRNLAYDEARNDLLGKSNLAVQEGNALALYDRGEKDSFRDENQLFGKEIEPLWRCESDGGLSNYLSNFLTNSEYKLLSTSKYEVHLDLTQLNRDDFVLNLQMAFAARINIAALNLVLLNSNVNYNNYTNAYKNSVGVARYDSLDPNDASSVYSGEVALVTGRPLPKDNNLTINLKLDLNTVTHFPLLIIRLVENDGTKSELRLSLPIGLFLSLLPLKYKLDQFENFWNSMELTVNRQIRLFLSKNPIDLQDLVNLLWKFFSVYLQDDVLLISSCGTEVLLGSLFIKQRTLIVVQLRSICNNLITSTMGLLKELFSSLSTRFDTSISNYTLKRVSALPLKFQPNVHLKSQPKALTNYQ